MAQRFLISNVFIYRDSLMETKPDFSGISYIQLYTIHMLINVYYWMISVDVNLLQQIACKIVLLTVLTHTYISHIFLQSTYMVNLCKGISKCKNMKSTSQSMNNAYSIITYAHFSVSLCFFFSSIFYILCFCVNKLVMKIWKKERKTKNK